MSVRMAIPRHCWSRLLRRRISSAGGCPHVVSVQDIVSAAT